jgi:transposase
MKVMAGIDLHSNNLVCAIVDMARKRLICKKLDCNLQQVKDALAPYKDRLDTIAVESTYNWYWLVDGLQDAGYKVVLANPARMEQYDGIKHADDKNDAFFLAELLTLGILPTGHLYDRQLRPVRDLLRRRLGLVAKRTSLYLSLKSLYARNTGGELSLKGLKSESDQPEALAKKLFGANPCDQLIAEEQLTLIEGLNKSLHRVEKTIGKAVHLLPCYKRLQTIPGVGIILGQTITLETGDIHRFATAGDYVSYCRCVKAERSSNNKSKGKNNDKCGNRYLSWAWVEAANFARRYDTASRKFFDRKAAQTCGIVATKALACKLAKAGWYVMKDDVDFDPARVFGTLAKGQKA